MLYSNIQERMGKSLGAAKTGSLTVLMADNFLTSKAKAGLAMMELYPTVMRILASQKNAYGYQSISHRLQRMESKVVIETACERLRRDYPDVPIVTIHDFIGSVPGYRPLLKRILQESFQDTYGRVPTIKNA
jgi:hypothetical protein